MKGLRIACLLVAVMDGGSCAAQKRLTDLEIDHINGRVKSVSSISDSTNLHALGIAKHKTRFNEQGNITLALTYGKDGVLADSTVFRFDKDGYKLEGQSYDLTSQVIEAQYFYRKNKTICLTVKRDLISHDIDSIKIDERSYEVERVRYTLDSGFYRKWVSTYNAKGEIAEKSCFDAYGNLREKWTYKFDEQGNEVESTLYSGKGKIQFRFSFKYDEHKNNTETCVYRPDGTISQKMTAQFNYDRIGNWVKEKLYYNGEPETVTNRIIKYYP